MKILTPTQIHQLDALTLKKQGLSEFALMDRAAIAIVDWLKSNLELSQNKIGVVCGVGNNGGDGLAVARLLKSQGAEVVVYVVEVSPKKSRGFLHQWTKMQEVQVPIHLIKENQSLSLDEEEVLIDALFGVGLDRPLSSWLIDIVKQMNRAPSLVVSIDIPSGMPTNPTSWAYENLVMSDMVLAIGVPKLNFFLPYSGQFIPYFKVLDIGYSPEDIASFESKFSLLDKKWISDQINPRLRFSHKWDYGHVQLVGGSKGKIGAMILAAKGALGIGAGLVTATLPSGGLIPFQTAIPEAMALSEDNQDYLVEMPIVAKTKVIVAGMGLGVHQETQLALGALLNENHDKKWVLDADALNIVALNKTWLTQLPPNTILTPHDGELERLVGAWHSDDEKINKVQSLASQIKGVIVVKGAYTLIVSKEQVWINTSGNPGMATAGSGDLLSGIIGGLLAQGYSLEKAAIIGVYVHGAAGDLSASKHSEMALTATKIYHELGAALKNLNIR